LNLINNYSLKTKKVHIYISGRVQGVSYRWWFQQEANKKNLKGWVRNTTSNRVEAEIIGEESEINKMIKLCDKGPKLANVTSVLIDPIEKLSEVDSDIKDIKILKTV
tara:strand:- start:36 stop:356 length:321 start_codon:yes stop_codon:yes gene_type:complete